MNEKVRIFYSYAHEDVTLRNQLEKHLIALQGEGLVEGWHDRDIQPGAVWEDMISEHLERADIILLLISVDFLSSRYCMGVEMARALERARLGEAVVIPILLRPVDWENTRFCHLQCLPTGGRPVAKWKNRDDAFLDIERGIRKVVERLRGGREAPTVQTGAWTGEPPLTQQDRVLDAAMAAKVPMGKPADLAVMVRRVNSPGLKAVLEVDDEYSGRPEDVRSKPFRMEFPLDDRGDLKAASLTLKLESPDFDPPSQTKKLPVPPDGDSEVCTFLLTPLFTGELVVNLEVYAAEGQQASRVFRVVAEASDRVVVRGRVLVSVPISTTAGKLLHELERSTQAAAAAAAPQRSPAATGAFPTPIASMPSSAQPQPRPMVVPPPAPAAVPPPAPVAVPPRKKRFPATPLATAATLIVMAGVASVYYNGQRSGPQAVQSPVETPPAVTMPKGEREPIPLRPAERHDPLSDLLAGNYVLEYTNLTTVAQFRAEIQLSRVGGDEFRYTSRASGLALPAQMPFQHDYQGTIRKVGSQWYVETTSTTDPTVARGAVPNQLTFANGVLTFRATNGLVMSWRKQ